MARTGQKAAQASRQARAVAVRQAAEREPRRRRQWGGVATVVAGVVLIAGAIVVVAATSGRRGDAGGGTTTNGPVVGGDLHALAALGGGVFVSGHGGAGVSSDGGRTWRQLPTLDDKDGMGWAMSGSQTLVGGHGGLYRSSDGIAFDPVEGLPVSDIHGLGAAGRTVYIASPQGGVFASDDGGRTWQARGQAGSSIMGSILVDAADPRRLIAPDMSSGVVASTDGGTTWRPLGGPAGAVSVDRDPRDPRRLVAVGMNGAQRSSDGGATWTAFPVPAGTTAVAFVPGPSVTLLAAALDGDRAKVFTSHDDGLQWAPTDS